MVMMIQLKFVLLITAYIIDKRYNIHGNNKTCSIIHKCLTKTLDMNEVYTTFKNSCLSYPKRIVFTSGPCTSNHSLSAPTPVLSGEGLLTKQCSCVCICLTQMRQKKVCLWSEVIHTQGLQTMHIGLKSLKNAISEKKKPLILVSAD